MKKLAFLYCFLVGLSLFAQKQRYYDQIDRTECDPISYMSADNIPIEIIDFDEQYYSGMVIEELNKKRKTRNRPEFKLDSTYNSICNTSVKHFSRSNFKR
mgnify:CR=1 FL=1